MCALLCAALYYGTTMCRTVSCCCMLTTVNGCTLFVLLLTTESLMDMRDARASARPPRRRSSTVDPPGGLPGRPRSSALLVFLEILAEHCAWKVSSYSTEINVYTVKDYFDDGDRHSSEKLA